jgi:hypothetical protein
MSADRSVRLDVSVPDSGPRTGEGFARGTGQQQRQPDAESRQRFDDAMRATSESGERVEPPQVPQPFALFGSLPPESGQDAKLLPRLDDVLDGLMVDVTGDGRQVRMDLKDEVMPGVTIVIQETQGRLQVDFICSLEDSRLKLNAAAPDHAPQLAQRLGRDVLLRVQTDDEEDPCLFEVAASA